MSVVSECHQHRNNMCKIRLDVDAALTGHFFFRKRRYLQGTGSRQDMKVRCHSIPGELMRDSVSHVSGVWQNQRRQRW